MIDKFVQFGIFAAIGYWFSVDISDVPLSQWTGKMIFNNLIACFFYYLGLLAFTDD